MTRLIFATLLLVAPVAAFAGSPVLIAPNGQYLGRLNGNRFDPDSVANPYGRFGNPYSPDSVNNPYGRYGNPYSPDSVTNPYGTGGARVYGDE